MNEKIEQSKRIYWIDVAKAISIILVIIGHVLPLGSKGRNFIF
jgi:fucose 4-O-acetylase-like acetyltransferase